MAVSKVFLLLIIGLFVGNSYITDLPKNCVDAQKKDFPPGETFIQPTKSVEPFFVYCDAEMVRGTYVTIIGNVQEEPTEFETDITITYHNVTFEQIEALIDGMGHCYQPVRVDCKKTKFIGTGGASWRGKLNRRYRYFGSSNNARKKCTCGMKGLCGGRGDKRKMMKRACNCDNADNVWRRDGGVLSQKRDLPLRSLKVPLVRNSKMALTAGKIYCADKPFDINECNSEAHRCQRNAHCVNTLGSYECVCNDGYKGDGVVCNSTCIDDHDCAENAICNMEFQQCQCRKGFEGPTDNCTDINECEVSGPCDQNATCHNLPGSYNCTCKPGLFGDGISCSRTPLSCESVLKGNPRAKTGYYKIDPDGEGPLPAIKVSCVMRENLGITIFKPHFNMWLTSGTHRVNYNPNIDFIRKVIEISNVCHQSMSYKGGAYSTLLDGGTYWTDGTGRKQYNWGGSNKTGMCLCGIRGYCKDLTKPCNNDGNTEEERWDVGAIIDKSLLPIQAITLKQKSKPALVTFHSVMCSSENFVLAEEVDLVVKVDILAAILG